MKNVVITGVSTGIGRDATRLLSENGFRVFGSVRKVEDAAGIREELGDAFHPLVFDVTDDDAVARAAREVEEILDGAVLDGLVNNSGIAVAGPLPHLPIEDARHQMEVNVIGLLRVTQAFLPLMGARANWKGPRGRVVNISSLSGRTAFPFVGIYAASKHALEGLSDSLRRELMLHGIDVIVIQPGAIRTPIWDKRPDITPYRGTAYEPTVERELTRMPEMGKGGLPPDAVSRVILRALTARRPRARYAVPVNRWMELGVLRWFPSRWIDRLIAQQLGWKTPSATDSIG